MNRRSAGGGGWRRRVVVALRWWLRPWRPRWRGARSVIGWWVAAASGRPRWRWSTGSLGCTICFPPEKDPPRWRGRKVPRPRGFAPKVERWNQTTTRPKKVSPVRSPRRSSWWVPGWRPSVGVVWLGFPRGAGLAAPSSPCGPPTPFACSGLTPGFHATPAHRSLRPSPAPASRLFRYSGRSFPCRRARCGGPRTTAPHQNTSDSPRYIHSVRPNGFLVGRTSKWIMVGRFEPTDWERHHQGISSIYPELRWLNRLRTRRAAASSAPGPSAHLGARGPSCGGPFLVSNDPLLWHCHVFCVNSLPHVWGRKR